MGGESILKNLLGGCRRGGMIVGKQAVFQIFQKFSLL